MQFRHGVCIKTEICQYAGQIDHILDIFFTMFLVTAQTVAVCLSNSPNIISEEHWEMDEIAFQNVYGHMGL